MGIEEFLKIFSKKEWGFFKSLRNMFVAPVFTSSFMRYSGIDIAKLNERKRIINEIYNNIEDFLRNIERDSSILKGEKQVVLVNQLEIIEKVLEQNKDFFTRELSDLFKEQINDIKNVLYRKHPIVSILKVYSFRLKETFILTMSIVLRHQENIEEN